MGIRNQFRVTSTIVESIQIGLRTCPRPKNKKMVMERILSSNILVPSMLESFLPPKVIVSAQELIAGMCTSLVETKQANSNVKLIAKHYIFKAVVCVGPSCATGIARMLGVHH
jgi:hypothetical protein